MSGIKFEGASRGILTNEKPIEISILNAKGTILKIFLYHLFISA